MSGTKLREMQLSLTRLINAGVKEKFNFYSLSREK